MGGHFRKVVDAKRVAGPIVITHSKNDTAVGLAYPIASRINNDVTMAIGDENDKFGGIGRNGAQKMESGRGSVSFLQCDFTLVDQKTKSSTNPTVGSPVIRTTLAPTSLAFCLITSRLFGTGKTTRAYPTSVFPPFCSSSNFALNSSGLDSSNTMTSELIGRSTAFEM